jgi:hypothetical protein
MAKDSIKAATKPKSMPSAVCWSCVTRESPSSGKALFPSTLYSVVFVQITCFGPDLCWTYLDLVGNVQVVTYPFFCSGFFLLGGSAAFVLGGEDAVSGYDNVYYVFPKFIFNLI